MYMLISDIFNFSIFRFSTCSSASSRRLSDMPVFRFNKNQYKVIGWNSSKLDVWCQKYWRLGGTKHILELCCSRNPRIKSLINICENNLIKSFLKVISPIEMTISMVNNQWTISWSFSIRSPSSAGISPDKAFSVGEQIYVIRIRSDSDVK